MPQISTFSSQRCSKCLETLCCFTAIVKWGQTSSHLLKTSSFKLLDSNRQPVYYYNEHGQVEIVVITRKEFFKLTFLSFGIPNANR